MATLIIVVLILGLLIFVHEFGHFISAKRAGLCVEEFGFGFPPRLFGFKRGETVYSINLLPLGGFVKILGEGGERPNDPRSFASKSIRTRALILTAGVIMNILLAMLLLIVGFKIGLPTVVDSQTGIVRDVKIQVVAVNEGSPAFEAGIKAGDEISEIEEEKVGTIEEVQSRIEKYLGEEMTLKIKRGDQEQYLTLIPREEPPVEEGPTGVALVKTGIVSYPWYEAIWRGVVATFSLTVAIIVALFNIIKNLLVGAGVAEEISGPVGIAVMTGQVARLGFTYVLQFTAVLSINFAILNILPFPALDGGRLLFLLIERVRGRKVSKKTENLIHMIGFVLLILLMILVTFRDVFKFKEIFINLWERIKIR
jgi:regulator of sigma E protease